MYPSFLHFAKLRNERRWMGGSWASFQYPKGRLIARSREVSKQWDWWFKLSHRFKIWQALRQLYCRVACQISEQSDDTEYKSRGFHTLRDLTKKMSCRILRQGPGIISRAAGNGGVAFQSYTMVQTASILTDWQVQVELHAVLFVGRYRSYISSAIRKEKLPINRPLTKYVYLRVSHTPGKPRTFSPPPTSNETAS